MLAAQFADQSPAEEFVVATDARRREVYWAGYAADGRRTTGPPVSAPADVPRRPTVGPAVDLYPDQLLAAPGPRVLDPGLLAVRGPGLPDAGREPLYLRRPDATEPTRRKSVLRCRGDRSRILAARRDDLAAIMALERAGFPEPEQWSERSWLGELVADNRRMLIARAHQPVGVITLQHHRRAGRAAPPGRRTGAPADRDRRRSWSRPACEAVRQAWCSER